MRIVWLEKPKKCMDIDEIREKLFNAHLLLNGFMMAADYFPDVTYIPFLIWFMGEAKEQRKGMWGQYN